MDKIIINRIRCRKCGDVITSKSVHDFQYCSCKACAVDGGTEYLRRVGEPSDYVDLSLVVYENDNEMKQMAKTIVKQLKNGELSTDALRTELIKMNLNLEELDAIEYYFLKEVQKLEGNEE